MSRPRTAARLIASRLLASRLLASRLLAPRPLASRPLVAIVALVLGGAVACEPADKSADTAGINDSGGQDDGSLQGDGGGGGEGAADCSGLKTVLWVGETGDTSDHPLVMAAAALGIQSPPVLNDEDDLAEALSAGDVGLLVIDAPTNYPQAEGPATLLAAREAGLRMIAGGMDLHRDPGTWGPIFGVRGVDGWDMRPITQATGAPTDLFAGPAAFPAPLDSPSSPYAVNHHVLTPFEEAGGGATAVLASFDGPDSGEAAIVTTFDGQVLVNGTFAANYPYVDGDEDGQSDAMELYINEIAYMGACGGAAAR